MKKPSFDLILASTSPYRAALLGRLGLIFSALPPNIDESPLPSETPETLVSRLSRLKAKAIQSSHPGAYVIGSDQTCTLGEQFLGKPHTEATAIAQLTALSGQRVSFYTGWCVSHDQHQLSGIDQTHVTFRTLKRAEIERYVALEQPLNCAGSFKSEGLGVCLFERIESSDPTALIGLPLIAVASALRELGINPLAPN